ncbi:uncharacterized protein LOC114379627 [Glycine soja]|uniref:uncharacterized protein LOC114379627 n=1 Tax=Glycine soja TaxID=3848 RepID=UPI0010391B8D|nr:uncharacterized protein LOC114379627 [Glycine soja]
MELHWESFQSMLLTQGCLSFRERRLLNWVLVVNWLALLGSEVIVTYLPDRLRLLRKNIEINMEHVSLRGSVTATELTWGDDLDPKLIDPTPDFGNILSLNSFK